MGLLGSLVVCAVCAFFVGGIPFGFVIARAKGIDIRRVGSGNIGATNVSRALGKKYALLVFFLDFLKGALSVLAAAYLCGSPDLTLFPVSDKPSVLTLVNEVLKKSPQSVNQFSETALLCGTVAGAFAVLGHCFSPYLKFHGGKGIATSAGVTLMLIPLPFLVSIAIWVLILFLFRYVSLASICAAFSLPIAFALMYRLHTHRYFWILAYCLLITVVVIAKHIPNIKRLVFKKEPKIGRKKEAEKQDEQNIPA